MSDGHSVEASACIGAASRDSKSVPIKNKDNLLPVLPAIFVFKSGAAGWLELPEELPPPEFPEFSAPDLPLRRSSRIHARQRRNRVPVIRKKVMPIRAAVSMKNGSGTILISRSVRGSSCQRSLVKKILWKIIKYFVKSVEMIPASRAVTPRNKTVPAQSIRGSRCFNGTFKSASSATDAAARNRQRRRSASPPRKRLRTSAICAFSLALKNSRGIPSTTVSMFRSSRLPRRYAIISSVTESRSSISIWTSSATW